MLILKFLQRNLVLAAGEELG